MTLLQLRSSVASSSIMTAPQPHITGVNSSSVGFFSYADDAAATDDLITPDLKMKLDFEVS